MGKGSKPEYFIARGVIGSYFNLPISKGRFVELKRSWELLTTIVAIEEGWDAVVQNYVEFEKALLESALHEMVISGKDFFSFQDARLQFGVRLSNLLSSCRAYLDHTPHYLGGVEEDPKWGDHQVSMFRQRASAEYDSRLGYRFMEALRAYAQHRGLPIHGTSYGSSWVEGAKADMLAYTVSSNVDLGVLRADPKFKKAAIEGIDGKNLKIEPEVRDYLEGLSAIHHQTRLSIQGHLMRAKNAVSEAIEEYRTASPDSKTLGLRLVHMQANGKAAWNNYLFTELPEYVERLQRKNSPMVNLKRRFVTTGPESNKRVF